MYLLHKVSLYNLFIIYSCDHIELLLKLLKFDKKLSYYNNFIIDGNDYYKLLKNIIQHFNTDNFIDHETFLYGENSKVCYINYNIDKYMCLYVEN